MYSNKLFYEFCPEHLLDETDKKNKEILKLAHLKLNEKHKEYPIEMSNGGIVDFNHPRISLSDDEFQLQDELQRKTIIKYIYQSKVKGFETLDEAIDSLLKESTIIYGWYSDVREYIHDLERVGKSYADKYSQNYWYFMEWQSDCFCIVDALVSLNNGNIPPLSENKEKIKENLSIHNSYRRIENKEMLLKEIIMLLETAYAWAYDSEESSWIMKKRKNSSDISFKKHVEIFIKLFLFVEKNVGDMEFPIMEKNTLELLFSE
jgi:hypothetical protein